MTRMRWRLAVACLAVIGAAFAAAGGSAGNRTADVSLEASGPAVTAAKTISYRASITNTGNSTFTHVVLRQKVPTALSDGVAVPATLAGSSCAAVVTAGEAVCDFGNLGAKGTIRATLQWTAPAVPGGTCTGCLTTEARWLINEGKPTNANEEFRTETVSATVLGGDGSGETKQAGGYETTAATGCTAPTGNLHTNQALTSSNVVSTTVCLPSFMAPPGSIDPGLASLIVESATHQHAGGHPHLGQSDVCIAAFGQSCGGTYAPQNFSPNVVTFIFRILDSALTTPHISALTVTHGSPPTPSDMITEVFHNGVLLPSCTSPGPFPEGCVVSITGPSGSPKVWTVVAKASTNGYWDW